MIRYRNPFGVSHYSLRSKQSSINHQINLWIENQHVEYEYIFENTKNHPFFFPFFRDEAVECADHLLIMYYLRFKHHTTNHKYFIDHFKMQEYIRIWSNTYSTLFQVNILHSSSHKYPVSVFENFINLFWILLNTDDMFAMELRDSNFSA